MTSVAAVLWDLDGTIVDSEDYWISAEVALANEHGATWTHEDGLWQVGQGLPVTAQAMIDRGVDLSIPDVIDYLAKSVLASLQSAIPWRPGAVALLQDIARANIPQALVTMSVTPIATFIANSIPGVHFDCVISGDTAHKQKPDPAPYLQAVESLSVQASNCVAFEDSPSGITSASLAGTFVIGVRHLVSIEDSPARVLWDSLSGMNFSDVVATRTRESHEVES
jgi:HAD superfamily hydrolase (TIGR01509 family)